MKFSPLLLLLLVIPGLAYGTHQSFDKPCSISVNGQYFPVMYEGEARKNPDGTYYPGDAFRYLFTYKGSETCQSFRVNPLYSEGLDILSHEITGKNGYVEHSHVDTNPVVRFLETTHYYKILETDSGCTVHKGGSRTCNTKYTLAENPIVSVREDQKMSKSQERKVYNSKGHLKEGIHITYTSSWGFTKPGQSHNHGSLVSQYEDKDSINSFYDNVKNSCSNLRSNQGCVFGLAETKTDLDFEKCLYDEVRKMGINPLENPNNGKVFVPVDDFCINGKLNLSLEVSGNRISCGSKECKTVKVTRTKNHTPTIIEPDFEIILEKPAVKDSDYYDGMNLDGTYYLHDPVAITHDPTLPFKEVRAATIQFETFRNYNLQNEFEFDCKENNCDYIISVDGLFPEKRIGQNGQGITIFNATELQEIGSHTITYTTIVKNLAREINSVTSSTNAEIVIYDPVYGDNYPYPLLKDNKEYAFDDRQAVALHYLGSMDDEEIQEQRRSKINFVYNIGIGLDPFNPHYLNQTMTISEGVNKSDYQALESYNNTAMFLQNGYGSVYFDYPLTDIVLPDYVNQYQNVTSFSTLYSNDFAADTTLLDHFSFRYPEVPFNKVITIKSINQNGTIINDAITLEILPFQEIKTEYINSYIYDKINFDTGNENFSNIIAKDIYPMIQEYSGSGLLNVTISKTPIYFDEFTEQTDSGVHFNGTLSDVPELFETPDTIRLSLPYDLGLSSLSPTSLLISVNGITNQFDERYYDYGKQDEFIINTQKDNKLKTERSPGMIRIYHPDNFGLIDSVFVNGQAVKQNCNTGCVLMFQPDNAVIVTVKNIWNGEASADLPRVIRPEIPIADEPNYNLVIAIILTLGMIYILYRKLKKNSPFT